MANRKDFETFYGDEEQLAEKIFWLGAENTEKFRNKMYAVTFVSDSNQAVLTEVTKFLLHSKHLTPYETEKIIHRYIVVFVYSYLRSKKAIEKIDSFDALLSKNLSVESLSSDEFTKEEKNNDFVKLYLKLDKIKNIINDIDSKLINIIRESQDAKRKLEMAEENYEDAMNDGNEEFALNLESNVIPSLKEIADKSIVATSRKTIINLLQKESHYFFSKRDIFPNVSLNNAKKYDEIISNKLVDNEFFNFNIKVDKDNFENFNKNFHVTRSKEYQMDIRKFLFGYLVYDCIKNDNLSLDKPVKLLDPVTIKVLLAKKNANTYYLLGDKRLHSIIEFIDTLPNEINKVDRSKIIPFNFYYNGELYNISEKGIKNFKK